MGSVAGDVVLPHVAPPRPVIEPRHLARGAAAAGTATFVALMSHLLAGGAGPGVVGVAVPLLLATSTCLVLARVRLPWLRLAVSVGVSQVLFHLLFSVGSGGGASPATGLHDHVALAASTGVGTPGHAGHASGSMWVAHTLAAVVTVLALRHGESALSGLARALARAAHRVLSTCTGAAPVRPHIPPARLPDEHAWLPIARVVVGACVVRRGPPAASAPVLS